MWKSKNIAIKTVVGAFRYRFLQNPGKNFSLQSPSPLAAKIFQLL